MQMTRQAEAAELKGMAGGFWIAQCLSVAVTLKIADYLKDGPKSSDQLAVLTACHAPALSRFLRALSSLGLLKHDQSDCFALTPLSDLLRTDAEGSVYAELRHVLNASNWLTWGQLIHSVRTGEAAFPEVFGKDVWSYRAEHSEANAIFDQMATAKSKEQADLIDHIDFSGVRTIADIGGGNGALLVEILRRQPDCRGILFDQPHVVDPASELALSSKVADRFSIVPGDFFEAVPEGCDLYLLKAILHNWNNEAAVHILRNCRKAMSPAGRILLMELVLEPSQSSFESFMDLHMLVVHGGQERTAADFRMLMNAAGFELTGIAKAENGISVLQGMPSG